MFVFAGNDFNDYKNWEDPHVYVAYTGVEQNRTKNYGTSLVIPDPNANIYT